MPIYLDYNATTPHAPDVVEAMRPFLEREFGNPSSSHLYGRTTRAAVEQARAHVAELLGTEPERIVFTSGGTESNNYAIMGAARTLRDRGNHIITSRIEHPSVLECCRALEEEGYEVTRLEADSEGRVEVGALEAAIRPDTTLVTIMHANNEIGTIQPIAEIARVARRHRILTHTDAAQSLGKIPVRVNDLDVDMLSVAGHKLYAPKGIGVLYLREGVRPRPLLYGGGQERGMRPGTESVLEIVGLGEACRIALRDLERNAQNMRKTRDLLHDLLSSSCTVRLNGHPDERLPNTLNLSFHGIDAQTLLAEIGDRVIASAGSACHAGGVALSPVITALGVEIEWARGALRFSTGRTTTEEEIRQAAKEVSSAYRRVSRLSPR